MPSIPFCTRKTACRLLLYLSVFPFLLTACFPGQPEKKSAKEKSSAEKTNTLDAFSLSQLTVPTNAAYDAVLDGFDKSDLQNINHALTVFANNKADSLSRDSMLISFNEFMTSAMQGYYETKLMGNRSLIEQFGNKEDQPAAQKLISSLASHGITLSFRDGDFYLEPDMAFIYSNLDRVLTNSSRNFLQIKINIAKGFNTGDSLAISPPDSLANQIVAWEEFLLTNPGYLLKDEIQAQYVDVLATYFSGMEQLPLFDPNTKMLEPKYQNSYLHYIENHPNLESTKMVRKFYDLLASKGFKYDEELDSFMSELNFIPTENQK